MKKILIISLILLSAMSLYSCGKSNGTSTTATNTFTLQGSGS